MASLVYYFLLISRSLLFFFKPVVDLTFSSTLLLVILISSSKMTLGNAETVPEIGTIEDFEKAFPSFFGPNDTLALLMDYDGTLAPITPHPDQTFIPPQTNDMLTRIVHHPKVFAAIISGRKLQNVKEKVAIDELVYAGNHGLEILYTDGSTYEHEIPHDLKVNFTKMITELTNEIERDGAWIENKQQSLTVHYRAVPVEQHADIVTKASEIIARFSYLPNPAHCAIEAKPPVQWNKGMAALYILESSFGANWNDNVKVIFVGDDVTDEDAMKALKGKAISLRVSSNPDVQTYANYRLNSTDNVHTMLEWIEKYYK